MSFRSGQVLKCRQINGGSCTGACLNSMPSTEALIPSKSSAAFVGCVVGGLSVLFIRLRYLLLAVAASSLIWSGMELIPRRPKTRLPLKQFGRLMLRFAKRHNVSAIIRQVIPRRNCEVFDGIKMMMEKLIFVECRF